MLVLSRRLNEKLLLPEVGASIQVVALHPASVRLGIEAPSHVSVVREEIYRPELSGATQAPVVGEDTARTLDRARARLAQLERQLGPNPGPAVQEVLMKLSQELTALRRDLEIRTARLGTCAAFMGSH